MVRIKKALIILVLVCFVISMTAVSASAGYGRDNCWGYDDNCWDNDDNCWGYDDNCWGYDDNCWGYGDICGCFDFIWLLFGNFFDNGICWGIF